MINCPQCNAQIKAKSTTHELLKCGHCGTTTFSQNNQHSTKSLLIKDKFRLKGKIYKVQTSKKIDSLTQYSIFDENKDNYILTIEDEDCTLTQIIDIKYNKNLSWHSLLPNTQIKLVEKDWLVTEKRQYQKAQYSYLTAQNAEVLVLIFQDKSLTSRIGWWIDTMEIKNVQ